MRFKFPAFIALCCILVYVGAVVFGAYRIYTNIKSRQQQAAQELDGIENLITQNSAAFFTEPFREQVRKQLEESKVLEGIIITGSQGPIGFEKKAGEVIRWDPNPRFITPFGYVGLKAKQVDIPGFRNVNIYSVLNAINYEDVMLILKQTLLAILGALFLSFLTMIITALRSRNAGSYDASAESYDTSAGSYDASTESYDTTSAGFYDSPETFYSAKETPAQDTFARASDYEPDFTDFTNDDFAESDTRDTEPSMESAAMQTESGEGSTPDDFEMDSFGDFDIPETQGITSGETETNFETENADLDLPDFDNTMPAESSTETAAETSMEENSMEAAETAAENSIQDDFDIPDFDISGLEDNAKEEETTTDDDFHLDDFLDENELELPKSDEPEVETIKDETPGNKSSGESAEIPNGLYSPRSNVGWEAYTKDRLASELHRCAASEQDLVVLLMECGPTVNCDGSLYKKIANEAVDLFNLRDLTFEHGERGITIIMPNTSLELGIVKAEEFHARLHKTYFDSFQTKNDFLTGISSRSGRLIEADRLLQEAGRALEKAKTEPPVVAFKSDPDKYRDYIRKGTSLD